MHELRCLGDSLCTTRRKRWIIMMILTSLTEALRSLSRREPLWRCSSRRAIYTGVLCLAMLNTSPALGVDNSQINAFKLYAHMKIVDAKQYRCLEQLYTKESNWNPAARNGSHYGIPQMRNVKLKGMDAFTQIDWGLRYITSRYKTPCKAWEFFQANRWH